MVLYQAPNPPLTIRQQMESPGDVLVAPANLSTDDKVRERIENGAMWCLLIKISPDDKLQESREKKGVGLFCDREWADQTDNVHQIRNHCLETDSLCLLVWCSSMEYRLGVMKEAWKNQAELPYGVLYGDHPDKPFLQRGMEFVNDPLGLPTIKSPATISFYDMSEYVAKNGYGLVLDHEVERKAIMPGHPIECELVTVFMPRQSHSAESPANELIGFLSLPSEVAGLEPGEAFFIKFPPSTYDPEQENGQSFHDDSWRCNTLNPSAFAPKDCVTIFLRRPMEKVSEDPKVLSNNPKVFTNNREPQPLRVLNDRAFNLYQVASNAPRQKVNVYRIFTQRPFKQQIGASFQLAMRASRQLQKAILASNALNLERRNVYQTIDPSNLAEYRKTTLEKELNAEQLRVFHKLQDMPGPIAVVQGPPGTGKTLTLIMLAMVFILHPKIADPDNSPPVDPFAWDTSGENPWGTWGKPQRPMDESKPSRTRTQLPRPTPSDPNRHQVLLTAPTNPAADNLALKAHEFIQHRTPPNSKKPKVVRVYPLRFEKDVYKMLDITQPSKAEDDHDDEMMMEMLVGYESWVEYVGKNKPQLKGSKVVDTRIRLHEMSLSHQMLEYAKEDLIWNQWLERREQFASLSDAMKEQFVADGLKLMQQVLADADVIVTTLFGAGEEVVHASIHPQAVFVDEAGMTTETDFWPIFARYDPGPFILVGDHHQLQSVVKGTLDDNQFVVQRRHSPFARFAISGYMTEILRVSHRMTEDILNLVSRVFYNGKIRVALQTALQNNPEAKRIRQWNNKAPFHKLSNVIFLNVDDSEVLKQGYLFLIQSKIRPIRCLDLYSSPPRGSRRTRECCDSCSIHGAAPGVSATDGRSACQFP